MEKATFCFLHQKIARKKRKTGCGYFFTSPRIVVRNKKGAGAVYFVSPLDIEFIFQSCVDMAGNTCCINRNGLTAIRVAPATFDTC